MGGLDRFAACDMGRYIGVVLSKSPREITKSRSGGPLTLSIYIEIVKECITCILSSLSFGSV